MSKLKFSKKTLIPSVDFEFEFEDETCTFTYRGPSTNQIKKAIAIEDSDFVKQVDFTTSFLKENIDGERKDELFECLEDANIMEFKNQLDEELGKQKKKK